MNILIMKFNKKGTLMRSEWASVVPVRRFFMVWNLRFL